MPSLVGSEMCIRDRYMGTHSNILNLRISKITQIQTIQNSTAQPMADPVPTDSLKSAGPSKYANIGKLIFLSFNFLILFTAFNSSQNIITKIYEQLGHQNLGRYSIVAIYVGLACSNIFLPSLVRKLGFRTSFFLSSIGYVLTLLAGIMTCSCERFKDRQLFFCENATILYAVNIATSLICGFAAAILWGTQGKYVTDISTPENKGLFFGIFWAIMNSSMLTGNSLSYGAFYVLDQYYYYCLLSGMGIVAMLGFLLLPNVALGGDKKTFEEPLLKTTNNADSEEQKTSVALTISRMGKFIQDAKFYPLILFTIFEGLIPSFYMGFMYKIVDNSLEATDDATQNRQVAFVLMALGFSELLAGMLFGKVIDKINKVKAGIFVCLTVEAALIVSIIAWEKQWYGLCFVAAFLWGFSDSPMKTLTSYFYSKDFGGSLEAFGVLRLFSALGTAIGFVLQITLGGLNPLVYVMVIVFIQVVTASHFSYYEKPGLPDEVEKDSDSTDQDLQRCMQILSLIHI
eukprot:TRINITY_DN13745_c0_g2_i3.p1 TRINITY_DN13745_c0_g2~~TRINITY_DN13745_c0_g2_i3.p1  ORF type:complete len:515 (+),score=117.20 TRINITY_DN13745_c0_g2_i3:1-1545(+)